MQYIIILGAFQALVAFMLHYSGREKKPADVLLSLMLLCLVTHLSIKFVIYTFSDNSTLKLGFNTFIDLAYGPLLWIFASRFQNDTKQLGKQCYLFLPTFFAALLYMMIIAGFLTHRGWAVGFLRVYNNITGYLIILSFSFFPLLTLHRLKTFGVFWKVEKVLIKRIAVLFLTLSGFWLGGKFVDSLNLFDAAIIPGIMRTVTYTILLGISILILHYRLMSQHWQRTAPEEPDSPPAVPEINLSAPLNREEPDFNHPPDVLTEAPRKMHLQPEQQAAIASKLLKKMQDDKMYTDPDLTLEKLAKALSIPRHHVSETLNQYLKKSFYQCVNEFRVEEVIRLLSKCKQQGINPGILSMAYEAGFQSKTTFNQYFKKRTGITPSEYLQKEDADRMQQAIAHTPNRMGNNRLTVT